MADDAAQPDGMAKLSTERGTIGVAEQGGGEAMPILFLHGVGSDRSVWDPQLEHFGRSRRAVALDYPGYGESEPAPVESSRDDYAAALLAAMDALKIERAHICGLSLGGVVAIAMHAAAPERCASLTLADTFAVHPDGQAIYDRSVEASQSDGMRGLAERRAPLLLAPHTPEHVIREVIETMARIDPAAYRIGARAVWLADQRDRAAAIRVQTLILVGELDPVTPPELSRDLATLIQGSKVEVIAGASHIANLDQPRVFNRLVEDFLSELEARG